MMVLFPQLDFAQILVELTVSLAKMGLVKYAHQDLFWLKENARASVQLAQVLLEETVFVTLVIFIKISVLLPALMVLPLKIKPVLLVKLHARPAQVQLINVQAVLRDLSLIKLARNVWQMFNVPMDIMLPI